MEERWILQFCHGYDGPFLDVARQYAALFKDTPYKVLTVFLTGEPSEAIRQGSASDEVVFLEQSKKAVRGLKLNAMLKLKQCIRGKSLTLIIAHRFKPLYIAALTTLFTRIPLIGVHHGFGDYNRLARRWFVRRFQTRLLLLGVSNAVRDEIRERLPEWPIEKIQTLYNRIDAQALRATQLSKQEAREKLGLPPTAFIIGNVGRLHPDKDQATLISAFALARPSLPAETCLVIMGKGPLETRLRAQANDLGISNDVHFLGQIPEARRYFRAFDIFALTSDHEPFGMVLLEAMAADLPVICTDCGGGREVVEGSGYLFPLKNSDYLKNILISLKNLEKPTDHIKKITFFSDKNIRETFFKLIKIR